MKEKHSFHMNQLALMGAAFIWIVGFILYQLSHKTGIHYWLGFGFGLLGLAAAAASAVLIGRTRPETEETAGIPVYYTSIYIVLVMAFNIFFALTPDHFLTTLFVVINLAALLVYVLLVYNAGRYMGGVAGRAKQAAKKTEGKADISAELGELISMSTDAGVKAQLLKLKEKVDYSNDISTETEAFFVQKLCAIRAAIAEGVDAALVRDSVKEAETVWNVRNSGAGR